MKKVLLMTAVILLLSMSANLCLAAPTGQIYDFSSMTDDDILASSSMPNGWGNLAGTRTSVLKPGDFGLSSDKQYLEITNTTSSGSWGVPPVMPGIHQFKDKVDVSDGVRIHLTTMIAAYDESFYQIGLYARRANVTYTDLSGAKANVGDADFSALIAVLDFEKSADGEVILAAWGKDITPEGFEFETNRFYKLDAVINGTTNTMDAYLDGQYLQTVDYSDCFAEMTASGAAYDFTDTSKYSGYYISQLKRIGIVQHKPRANASPMSIALYNTGYMGYGAGDEMPPITFKNDDLAPADGNGITSDYTAGDKLIHKNVQAKIADIKAAYSGAGKLSVYRDSEYAQEYADDEYIQYPAYARYIDSLGFTVKEAELVSELYLDNVKTAAGADGIEISGELKSHNPEKKTAVVLMAGYKENRLAFIDFISVPADEAGFEHTITAADEYDTFELWAIDSWNTRSVISKIYEFKK